MTSIASTASPSTFAHFPIALFGSVMGLTGLGVAWHLAHDRFGVSPIYFETIGAVAILAFIAVSCGYAIKLFTAPQAVAAEFSHPIVASLFATFLISLLLLPMVIAPLDLLIARVVWFIGAAGMAAFAWFMVDRWMSHRQQAAHAAPTWIMPVVGLLDVPLAVPALGLEQLHGVMVFSLAVGLFFTVPLFTMIFSRMVFEDPLPDALLPTQMILLAPFAVGTSSYIATSGHVDLFAESLFGLTLFMLAVLAGRLRHLVRCSPFKTSWWAVSFPLAATSTAALRISAAEPGIYTDAAAIVLLGLATIVIAALFVRTLFGVARGELAALTA